MEMLGFSGYTASHCLNTKSPPEAMFEPLDPSSDGGEATEPLGCCFAGSASSLGFGILVGICLFLLYILFLCFLGVNEMGSLCSLAAEPASRSGTGVLSPIG